MPLWGVYNVFWSFVKFQENFQFWDFYTLIVAPMGMKFGMEE